MFVGTGPSLGSQSIATTAEKGPISIQVSFENSTPVIALGSDLKCRIYALENDRAVSIDAFGCLDDCDNYRRFVQTADSMCKQLGDTRFVIAHDLHPAFATTSFAREWASRIQGQHRAEGTIAVQHHHAHIAACMVENQITEPVIGVACDGTGYGTDGRSWGCEILIADLDRFSRFGHLDYFELPGGDAAAAEPWRCALSLVNRAFDNKIPANIERVFDAVARPKLKAVRGLLSSDTACPMSTSLGRLFDAVSFICGVCERNTQEGRAAQLLESVADPQESAYKSVELTSPYSNVIDPRPLIHAVCQDLSRRVAISVISGRFHASIADAIATLAIRAAEQNKINTAVLSGGCFVNDLLRTRMSTALCDGGLQVRQHHQTSCGDLDLGLGQAVIAAAKMQGSRHVSSRSRKTH